MTSHAIAVYHDPEAFRRACDQARSAGKKVALVPTMGALHEGHLRLVEQALRRAEFVAVSVFVNPTQFGPNEDLDAYPRTLDADVAACAQVGASCVFAPGVEDMYPPGERTRVHVSELTDHLCGAFRPGHFDGVATIVTKLLALTGPSVAVFGRKDYQQLKVIERFTKDLLLPVEIVGVPTVREPDGLARSSRNAYLTAEQRKHAVQLPMGLSEAVVAFEAGERDPQKLEQVVRRRLETISDRIDYVSVVDADTLQPVRGPIEGERALLAAAVYVGRARLIDNVVLGEDPAPREVKQ